MVRRRCVSYQGDKLGWEWIRSQYFNSLVVGNNDAGDKGITIRSNAGNSGVLAFSDSDAATSARYAGYISHVHSDNSMRFHTTAGDERLLVLQALE